MSKINNESYFNFKYVSIIFVLLFLHLNQLEAASVVPITKATPGYFGSHFFKFLSSDQHLHQYRPSPGRFSVSGTLGRSYSNVQTIKIFVSSFQSSANLYFGFILYTTVWGSPLTSITAQLKILTGSMFLLVGFSVLIITTPFHNIAYILEYTLQIVGVVYSNNIVMPASYDYWLFITGVRAKAGPYPGISGGPFIILNPDSITVTLTSVGVQFRSSNFAQEAGYDYQLTAFIMIIDKTKKLTMAQFSLLSWNKYQIQDNIFPTSTFGINTAIYGTDFDKKCMIGFHRFDLVGSSSPYLKFDLNPAIGIVNGAYNSPNSMFKIQSVCFQTMVCPSTHPFQKKNDVNCYNCLPGTIYTTQQLGPNCLTAAYSYQFSITATLINVCTECLTCNTNSFLQNGACILCSSRFTYCTSCSATNCTQCTTGYVLNSTNNSCDVAGVVCLINEFVENATCFLCSSRFPNCDTCNQTFNCDTCLSGFNYNSSTFLCDVDCPNTQFFQNGTCNLCALRFPNCATCNKTFNCDTCLSGFNFNTTTSLCDINCPNTQFFQNTTCNLCAVRFANCTTCNSSYNCLTCQSGYDFNNFTFMCDVTCLNGQFSENNTCYLCSSFISNCVLCDSKFDCTSCVDTFFLSNGSCVFCAVLFPHCLYCISADRCGQCQDGYVIENGNCILCGTNGYHQVGPYCIRFPGCLNTAVINSSIFCISCITQLGFTYNSVTKLCTCQKGVVSFYENSFPTKCVTVCGDGYIIFPEICDDNNTIQNDGCSQQCIVEDGFVCSGAPSKCVIKRDFIRFQYNYIQRIRGQNNALMTFTLTPHFVGLEKLDWSRILSFNFGQSKVDSSSFKYLYDYETSTLKVQFAYFQSLQFTNVQALLTFTPDIISSTPTQHKIKFSLEGINEALIFQDASLLMTYQITSYMSLVIMILVLIQFFVGSYFSKMIGLETIQIVQFIYFSRILLKRSEATVMNALNQLKYSAFGGYSQPEIIFGPLKPYFSEKFESVNTAFISIDLQKYFMLNVNFSLSILIVTLIVYCVHLIKKYSIRSEYISTRVQLTKDKYTIQRRTTERCYDNFIFPYTLLFNFVLIYNGIYFLQSEFFKSSPVYSDQSLNARRLQQSSLDQINQNLFNPNQRLMTQTSLTTNQTSNSQFFSIINFSFFLFMLILNFGIYTYELFLSYSEYKRCTMTERQKSSMPFSLIQKLEYDQNDLYLKKNSHSLYCFVYLLYYQLLTLVIFVQTHYVEEFKFGLQIVTGLTLIYFIFILVWKPYKKETMSHNYFLILNHFTVLFFLGICLIFQRTTHLQTKYYIILISLVLFLLVLVVIGGYIRIFIQYRFNTMIDQNMITKDKIPNANKVDSINSYLKTNKTNKYLFRNQLQEFYRQRQNSLTIKTRITSHEQRQNIHNDDFQDQWRLNQEQQKTLVKIMRKQYQQKNEQQEKKNKQIEWERQKADKQKNISKKLKQEIKAKNKDLFQKDNIRINDDFTSYKDCLIDQADIFVKLEPGNKKQHQNFIKAMQNLHINKSKIQKSKSKSKSRTKQ